MSSSTNTFRLQHTTERCAECSTRLYLRAFSPGLLASVLCSSKFQSSSLVAAGREREREKEAFSVPTKISIDRTRAKIMLSIQYCSTLPKNPYPPDICNFLDERNINESSQRVLHKIPGPNSQSNPFILLPSCPPTKRKSDMFNDICTRYRGIYSCFQISSSA